MVHIAIRLNPQNLTNPDLDLRYEIPSSIESATSGRIRSDGYDYANDDANTLIVFLLSDSNDAADDVKSVIETLMESEVCGNRLLESVVIGVSKDARSFSIVYPSSETGTFVVNPW